jgi:A/G-specific adenine glycosylase
VQLAENHPNPRRAALQSLLLRWFAGHARDLPWRHTRDPYRIMVSEIMLQQTQVDRVIPKYHAFLELFPTLEVLAGAPTADVIRAWAGLGYNRRAVNMQRAARVVLERHEGQFPSEVAALLDLPGIGPYTAGAIACFAYEQDVAFLDTNIRRVVRRLLVPAEGSEPTERELIGVAQAIIPIGQGWLWNQAIMELGALICSAASPACWRCPLHELCLDYAARQQADAQALDSFRDAESAQRPHKRIAEKRETPFVGSSRYYRGRVVEALRRAPEGVAFTSLGPLVKETYTDSDDNWLQGLIVGLVRDGLVVLEHEWVRLPD